MEKSALISKTIIGLKEGIEKDNYESLQEFWGHIETKGSPVIEKIDGDDENVLVTFIYKADEEIENVVLIPPIGWNNLLKNKMERLLNTNLWYITYKIRNDVRFDYHFSVNDSFDDDWEKREEKLVRDKYNKNKLIFKWDDGNDDDILPYVIMPNAVEHIWIRERHGIPKGELHEYKFYSNRMLSEHRIRIYTPHSYKENEGPYRLLVLTDGEVYINTLSAIPVLDNLSADRKILPTVVLFIDQTDARVEELMLNGSFESMIVDELIPWSREKYNISHKASDVIIGGMSLGGLTAAHLALTHPEVFGNVLSQSGSYWYKPENYEGTENDCWLSTQFEKIDILPLKFYLNVGILDVKENMIDTNIKLRDILLSKGYSVDFEIFKSGHDYLCWGETLANGLMSLAGIN